MPNRRSVLIGLGGLVAGGGALIGTGAFDTVEAERTVSVETAGDASAFLGFVPARGELGLDGDDFAQETDGTVEISIGEGGQRSQPERTHDVQPPVLVQNNGTQQVDEITLEFTESEVDADDTFGFPVADTDGRTITSDIDTLDHDGAVDILNDSSKPPDNLSAGDAVVFGLEIDLLDGGDSNNDLPEDGAYTLTITAE